MLRTLTLTGVLGQEVWPEVLRCMSQWEALVQGQAGTPTDALLFSQPDKQPGSAKKKPASGGFFSLTRSHASDGAALPAAAEWCICCCKVHMRVHAAGRIGNLCLLLHALPCTGAAAR